MGLPKVKYFAFDLDTVFSAEIDKQTQLIISGFEIMPELLPVLHQNAWFALYLYHYLAIDYQIRNICSHFSTVAANGHSLIPRDIETFLFQIIG